MAENICYSFWGGQEIGGLISSEFMESILLSWLTQVFGKGSLTPPISLMALILELKIPVVFDLRNFSLGFMGKGLNHHKKDTVQQEIAYTVHFPWFSYLSVLESFLYLSTCNLALTRSTLF